MSISNYQATEPYAIYSRSNRDKYNKLMVNFVKQLEFILSDYQIEILYIEHINEFANWNYCLSFAYDKKASHFVYKSEKERIDEQDFREIIAHIRLLNHIERTEQE